jgi:DNA-binding SARP family transcriptional activator/tetratricopeptide (TPR) repeat protein
VDESSDVEPAVPDGPLLRLSLFGQMHAVGASGRSVLPRSRKARAVLAILALASPKPVLRSKLTGLLWSQRAKEQARGSLRQSVHELQRALGQGTGTFAFLHADRNYLILLENRLWVDVRVTAGATAADPQGLEVFRPTLLEDLEGLDPAFDTWLAEQRLRVTQQALSVAEAVLRSEQETGRRIAAAERLLAIDRMNEPAWQALIRAQLEQGDRAAAQLAFGRYSSALLHVGRAPSPETAALIRGTPRAQRSPAVAMQLNHVNEGIRLCVLRPRSLDGSRQDGSLPGLAEEIAAAVSRFRWVSCVAAVPHQRPNKTPLYDPGTDYLLDSTLQRFGKRTRIILRLLDLHTGGKVVWALHCDREVDDVLTVQSEIAGKTAAQIDPELLLYEGKRRILREPGEATAFDLTLRAIPAIYRLEASGFFAAGELLSAAVAMEPSNVTALSWCVYWHLLLVGQAWARDPVEAMMRASELAERAVTLDSSDARTLTLVGHLRGFLHRRAEEACALHERAISLNPNLSLAWCFSGLANCYLGRHATAIEQIERARHLSPHDPHAFFFDMALLMPHLLQGQFEEALALGRRSIELNPGFTSTYKGYLATLGHLGRDQEAARVLARLLTLEPRFCVRGALERSPIKQQADLDFYAEGLRRGGLPES